MAGRPKLRAQVEAAEKRFGKRLDDIVFPYLAEHDPTNDELAEYLGFSSKDILRAWTRLNGERLQRWRVAKRESMERRKQGYSHITGLRANGKLRKCLDELEDKYEDDWPDILFRDVANGMTMNDIATKYEFPYGRTGVYDWMRRASNAPELQAKLKEARAQSGYARLEDGERILDDLAAKEVYTTSEVQLAKERAKFKAGLAQLYTPELRPNQPQVAVNINLSDMHLDALRRRGHVASADDNRALPPSDPPERDRRSDEQRIEEGEFRVLPPPVTYALHAVGAREE